MCLSHLTVCMSRTFCIMSRNAQAHKEVVCSWYFLQNQIPTRTFFSLHKRSSISEITQWENFFVCPSICPSIIRIGDFLHAMLWQPPMAWNFKEYNIILFGNLICLIGRAMRNVWSVWIHHCNWIFWALFVVSLNTSHDCFFICLMLGKTTQN